MRKLSGVGMAQATLLDQIPIEEHRRSEEPLEENYRLTVPLSDQYVDGGQTQSIWTGLDRKER
jgi:hypothetical protein